MRTPLSRRQLFSLGAGALASYVLAPHQAAAQAAPTLPTDRKPTALMTVTGNPLYVGESITSAYLNEVANSHTDSIVYAGTDLTDWRMVVGDGLYVAPGEPPISTNDISTTHLGHQSELRANIQRRKIMVHNLMFKKVDDPVVLNYIHICSFDFRLPFWPTQGNQEINGQTLEGGVAIWEGAVSRLVHNVAFQWHLNPYGQLGTVRTWSSRNGGYWRDVGYLAVDTEWHRIQFVNDYNQRKSVVTIDGVNYTSELALLPGPTGWGSDVSASLGAEIISIYPEGAVERAMHIAEFRNWRWEWAPTERTNVFLPVVMR